MENNLNLYHIFYTVAKNKNISGAAKELFISQPAISKAIAKLENNLDTKLFMRSSRGVTLTNEGVILYEQVKNAFMAIQSGEDQLHKIATLGVSHLSIGVSITLCKYVLLPYLQEFIRQNPHITISITCHPSMETIQDIEKGVTEIGLVGIPSNPGHLLCYEPIKEIQDTFIATDNYLKNLRIREGNGKASLLSSANFMMLNKENVSRMFVDQYLAAHQITMTNILEINTMDLLIELAKIDLGIACVIRDFVEEDIENGTFKELTFKRTIPKRKIGFTYREDLPMSDSLKKFIDFIHSFSEVDDQMPQ